MKLMHKSAVWPVFVCLLLCAGLAQAANTPKSAKKAHMHKCVAENGQVRYTDNPGADCAQIVDLNKQGVKLERPAPAKEARAPAQNETAGPEAVAAARRDKTILATYTSESQIEEAKARNLEPPLQAVKLGQTHLDRARTQLDELKKQEDALKRQKKPLPAGLSDDLERGAARVAHLENEMARKQARVDDIAARFDADLKRFRELRESAAPR